MEFVWEGFLERKMKTSNELFLNSEHILQILSFAFSVQCSSLLLFSSSEDVNNQQVVFKPCVFLNILNEHCYAQNDNQ